MKEILARAKMAIRPEVRAAFVIAEFGGHSDVAALAGHLKDGMNDVSKQCEEMLYSQAHVLQAVFVDALRQVPKQGWFSTSEAYMRMAMKAQNQCRMTLETLARISHQGVSPG